MRTPTRPAPGAGARAHAGVGPGACFLDGQECKREAQHVSRSVAIRLRQASRARYAWPRTGGASTPVYPRQRCLLVAGRSSPPGLPRWREEPAVDLSLRTTTLPVLTRRPMRRLTDAVIRPPWWPHRPLPRAGSPLVRPAGCPRRPTGGVGTGTCSPLLSGKRRQGRSCRIRTLI